MTENESDSGPRISSIIQIVLVSNDGEWEWFWMQNQSHYPSGQNPEIRNWRLNVSIISAFTYPILNKIEGKLPGFLFNNRQM